ncbi:hypothetical protein P692DRAFT_20738306 [Suillus brevipes Sb2]|nr:hypothetical protein P692DRAFT_20738306 [Suillus brevipes Sb2]
MKGEVREWYPTLLSTLLGCKELRSLHQYITWTTSITWFERLVLKVGALPASRLKIILNGIFCIVDRIYVSDAHHKFTIASNANKKLLIALENYRSWTVPTFTTYLHSCVIHTMAINMSLYDQKSGCQRVTGILFRMCDFWVVSHSVQQISFMNQDVSTSSSAMH